MRKHIGIRSLILVCAVEIGGWAKAAVSSCPSQIDSLLCKKLESMQDSDRVICRIFLNVSSQWAHADGGCDKTHPACTNPASDTGWKGPWRDSILSATRLLFENYDLRWPDNPQTRALVPGWDGKRDTVTGTAHALFDTYYISATKSSILSLVGEAYIQAVLDWEPDTPAILRSKPRPSLTTGRAPLYNLNGQKIEPSRTRGKVLHGRASKSKP